MKLKNWFQKNNKEADFQTIEDKFQSILVKVDPRPEFVSDLRKNLLMQFSEVEFAMVPKGQKLQTGLLITGGVLGSFAMILTGVRGAVSIIGIIGLLISVLKHTSQDTPVPCEITN
jgi:hypothetical protein